MVHGPQKRFSAHLMLEQHPDSRRFYGHLAPGLGLFAEPTVTYQENSERKAGELMTPRQLAAAFFDVSGAVLEAAFFDPSGPVLEAAISRGWVERSLETWRSLLIDAITGTLERFSEATAEGIGRLDFSVLSARSAGHWMVFHIGTNVVLKISAGRVWSVFEPHSPNSLSDLDPLMPSRQKPFTSVSTARPDRELRYADELRSAEVELRPGDWLMVAPGSRAAAGFQLAEQPNTLADIEREVISRLAAPYVAYTRSWLSIHALPIEEADTGPRHHAHG